MTQENIRHNVTREWHLSDLAWREAEALLAAGLFRGAITRYYYGVFHAARAALLARELEPTTHSGVRSEFSRTLVHAGLLPRETARILGALLQERQEADYAREADPDGVDAQEAREDAATFRDAVQSFLRVEGWLG